MAPRFSLSRPWEGRFERNGGADIDRETGEAHPRDDWRHLDAGSLASLVAELPGRDAVLPPTHLGLLQLPERLRGAWWGQAERAGATPGTGPGVEKVFSQVVEFLRFKRLPLPERVEIEVAVSAPGLRSTRGAAGETPGHLPLGLVNLGDERSFVVLLELPPATLARRLEAAGEAGARHLAPRALAARYLEAFPQQPFLRVSLAPGEGLWLSPFGVAHDGWTLGKQDVDVMLGVAGIIAGGR